MITKSILEVHCLLWVVAETSGLVLRHTIEKVRNMYILINLIKIVHLLKFISHIWRRHLLILIIYHWTWLMKAWLLVSWLLISRLLIIIIAHIMISTWLMQVLILWISLVLRILHALILSLIYRILKSFNFSSSKLFHYGFFS